MSDIIEFKNKYYFLSNFFPSPIVIGGFEYSTVEHWYQANKTTDRAEFNKIRKALTPGLAKRLGRRSSLRSNWKEIRDQIMFFGVFNKFLQNPELAEKLIETGCMPLVEGNTWHDNYWGQCFCEKCRVIRGQNKLGRILESVRSLLLLLIE